MKMASRTNTSAEFFLNMEFEELTEWVKDAAEIFSK